MNRHGPIAGLFCMLLTSAAPAVAEDLSKYFAGLHGTFVLYDAQRHSYIRHNAARAAERFHPCSTYKIPNSLIAVETGVATDANFLIPYDARRDPQQPGWLLDWPRDHTLRSAFKYSVVWYYQEIARRTGRDRMERYVRQFQYGNQDISGAIDQFWLTGPLRISADEQVAFLQRLYEGKLGLAPRTTDIVKDIMVADQGPGWKLSAKTGACGTDDVPVVWYVGFVEKNGGLYYFALNLGGSPISQLAPLRITKTREILNGLGIIPAPESR
ncbi:MAG TPA: penicillin-binding transpeptidase domain-containing protein [Bryobacteraceae bacterium]|nr:penicillin-binding transpeptidase domain-containing protein [Bryobacteraceae bacterium]